jgi:hypothetical protein
LALLGGALAGWPLIEGSVASACSEVQMPGYAAFAASVPAAGAEQMPIDTAVAVDLEIHGHGLLEDVTISVFEADGLRPVPGTFAVYSWDRPFAGWRPAAVLQPGTRYQVEAVARSRSPRPASARGPEQLSFSFVTGDQRSRPLVIAGRMEAQLADSDRPDYSTCTPGLCTCTPTTEVRGTLARLKLPHFSGGQAQGGYFAQVMVTADRPFDFAEGSNPPVQHVFANGGVAVRSGQIIDQIIGKVDDPVQAYRPCFALKVMDVAGNTAVGEPLCLDQIIPAARQLEAKPGSSGCQLAGPGGQGRTSLGCLLLLGLLVIGLRLRPVR